MRNFLFLSFFVALFAIFSVAYIRGVSAHGTPSSSRQTTVNNQDSSQKSRSGNRSERVVNQVGSGNTYMIVDAANNRVKVIVEGKEVAYFHKGGLHVDGEITTSAAKAGGR